MIGDTAYGSIETRNEIEALGAELIAKAPPAGRRRQCFSVDDFKLNTKRGVATCPAGKRSIRRDKVPGYLSAWRYVFSRNDCNACPIREQYTTSEVRARMVTVTAVTQAQRRYRRRQKTKAFLQIYRRRIVVEHRIGRLQQLGIKQARFFGKQKIAFQVAIAATVANLGLAAAKRSKSLKKSLFVVVTSFLRLLENPWGQIAGNPRFAPDPS